MKHLSAAQCLIDFSSCEAEDTAPAIPLGKGGRNTYLRLVSIEDSLSRHKEAGTSCELLEGPVAAGETNFEEPVIDNDAVFDNSCADETAEAVVAMHDDEEQADNTEAVPADEDNAPVDVDAAVSINQDHAVETALDTLETSFSSQVVELKSRLSNSLASACQKIARVHVDQRIEPQLISLIDQLCHDTSRVRIAAPQDILTRLQTRLAGSDIPISWIECDAAEVKISFDDTVIETCVADWLRTVGASSL